MWAGYLTIDHFASNGYGIVWKAVDMIQALGEGQRIRALYPNCRAFFIVPFLKSIAFALAFGWAGHALAVTLGLRFGRRLDSSLVADYGDRLPNG